MSFKNAEHWAKAAQNNFDLGDYQTCVYLCCLAAETYFKSIANIIDATFDTSNSHDIIYVFQIVSRKYKPSQNLTPIVRRFRKYFNEARYPADGNTDIYNKNFAQEFIEGLKTIVAYIENECHISLEDLQKKFRGSQ